MGKLEFRKHRFCSLILVTEGPRFKHVIAKVELSTGPLALHCLSEVTIASAQLLPCKAYWCPRLYSFGNV